MGASVRPIPVTGRDLIARAVAPQSTQVGMGRPVALGAPFANLPVSRVGPAMPGNLPVPMPHAPDETSDLGSVAAAVARAMASQSGATDAFNAGKALSSGRGFDQLGGKQPIAGPLTTAVLTALPLVQEAPEAVRGVSGAVSRAVSRAMLPADIMDGIPVDASKFAPRVRQDPMAALAQRFQAMDEAPRTLLPSGGKFGRPWPAPEGFTPSVDRPSIARTVMDSVATRGAGAIVKPTAEESADWTAARNDPAYVGSRQYFQDAAESLQNEAAALRQRILSGDLRTKYGDAWGSAPETQAINARLTDLNGQIEAAQRQADAADSYRRIRGTRLSAMSRPPVDKP